MTAHFLVQLKGQFTALISITDFSGCEMMKRFITAALSAVLFATIFSWFFFVPSSQREPNVYYSSFSETFTLVIIYAGPVFFLVGLPLSIFIDKLDAKFNKDLKWTRYFFGLGLYSLAGILFGVVFLSLLNPNIYLEDVFSFSLCCFIASTIYYHLLLSVSKINLLFN
ncbi:arginine exporter protein ArgO [Sporosarcina sp. JAI121]|nr:arginine exporter protein ArgO [Sporosarcina sp. JAI121]